jgi:hypothetical protein
MRMRVMLRPILTLLLFCLLQAEGWGAAGDATCLQEKQRLQAQEAEQCNGWSYIFNPSACFITRKALAAFNSGKCREIAAAEGNAVQPVNPAGPAALPPPAQAASAACSGPAVAEKAHFPHGTTASAAAPAVEIEQLRREISELREELERLKEQLSRQGCLQR